MLTGERSEQIASIASILSAGNEFDDIETAQYKALNWVTNLDALYLCPDDPTLAQRYILAVLYYQTSGDSWLRCTSDGLTSCDGAAFLSAESECKWGGIGCDTTGQVTDINLSRNNLAGALPSEIGSLAFLVELLIDKNALTGPIPVSFGALASIEYLDMDNNNLTGSIPIDLYGAKTLRVIDLDHNELSGTLATEIGQLSDLYYLQLDFTRLSGTVPSELAALPELEYLSLFVTDFSGPIPEDLCGREIQIFANCDICATDGCCKVCVSV
jgi:Leucine-rich repeat (LRR) protein